MKPTIRTAVLFILYALFPALLTAQAGWKPDERLTYFQGYSYDPRAACCGDTIHLVWWEGYVDTMIHEEVYYKRSTDAGESWAADVLLSIEDDNASVQPTIGVNDNYLHVVWKDEHAGVCYRKSTDGGNTWLQIDTLPNAGLSEPWVHVDGTLLYVISGAGTGFQVFTKSTDNGVIWQTGQNVMHSCGAGRIKKVDSLLFVSHQDDPYSVEIYCLKSTDDGQTWCDTICVSPYDSVTGQRPAMDLDDSAGVHITWYDYKYSPYPWTGDIFYRASHDSGNTWETVDSLTTQHRARASDILAESNNLHLVWEDDRHDFSDNFEIYYRMSSDLGQTWENEVRLTDALNGSRRPFLACHGQYLHLFWFDLRDDPSNIVGEIYYKRKTLTGIQETAAIKYRSLGLYCSSILRKNSLIRYDLGDKKQGMIDLIDVTGRVVMTFPVHCNSGEFVLNLNEEVGTGVYFLRLESNKEVVTKKVIMLQ